MSGDSLKTFDMYARMIAETEYFVTIIDILINYVEDVANTEFGIRFSKMIPMLMQAHDMNQVSYFEKIKDRRFSNGSRVNLGLVFPNK